jgi:hypothetical protein
MIEVARALVESRCRLQYTVIFVAFDKEEVGSQGSHEFVRGFLVPTVFRRTGWPEFQVPGFIFCLVTSRGSRER